MVIAPVAYSFVRRGLSTLIKQSNVSKNLGRADDFKVGTSRVEYLASEKVVIGRTSEGDFHAVSAVCTHLGCSIRFETFASMSGFVCNCHSSKFDLDGLNLTGPAPTPLKSFEVVVIGGEVVLRDDL